ncbi:hypothetical protein CCACVL1_22377 [Corchorus capsularis]|uniref:Uncharacterized protein n=1 Tax=Corchorus capsularis TaxID=210143 RepID=A0A1R3GZZ7_COCAP|nr:hypothetical protein CCACVL1_22377 [Corchorus capsularis]
MARRLQRREKNLEEHHIQRTKIE